MSLPSPSASGYNRAMRVHARRCLLLLTLALCLSPLFAQPGEELSARLDRVFADPHLQGASLGVCVRRLDGTVLYERGADKPLMPASNMKLVTAATALRTWGEDFRFATALYADAMPSTAGVVAGNLYLKGSASPRLDSGFLLRVAKRLRADGLCALRGAVIGAGPVYSQVRPQAALLDARELHNALNKLGVVIGKLPQEGEVPAEAVRLYRWESDPTSVLLTVMNKRSDNAIAEGFLGALRYLHQATEGLSNDFVQAAWQGRGLCLDGCRFVDGSGLSRQNRLTARFLTDLLVAARSLDEVGKRFVASLPVAGQDGTLRLRMRGTPAAGCVRAKTGFLTGACTLSGYVERGGQGLCFSILMNNHRCGPEPMRAIQNRACAELADWLGRSTPAGSVIAGQPAPSPTTP